MRVLRTVFEAQVADVIKLGNYRIIDEQVLFEAGALDIWSMVRLCRLLYFMRLVEKGPSILFVFVQEMGDVEGTGPHTVALGVVWLCHLFSLNLLDPL